MFDAQKIKNDFPIFTQYSSDKPLVYLDSGATSLKPQSVIDEMNEYYTSITANVFRGIYALSEKATQRFEESRETIARFIHGEPNEVIFTRNTTESLNILAYSFFDSHIREEDEVVTTILEHHSNFVPWQQLGKRRNVHVEIWKCSPSGELNIDDLDTIVTRKTKVFTFTAVSNVLGSILPVKDIVTRIKKIQPSCLVVVDAAQAVPHMSVDVSDWGADAVAFSGHKMCGPTGIGILWAKQDLLESLAPFLYGGDMIKEVHTDRTVFNDIPHKFEAGTPHIAGAMGLRAAVKYLEKIGMDAIREHEEEIMSYALIKLSELSDLTIYGPHDAKRRSGVIAFRMKGIHPHDIAQVLDQDNICIRVGFHCAQPLHEHLEIGPTARASFYMYTTKNDIDLFVQGLEKVRKIFR